VNQRVSVIIPAFKAARTICRAIDSVLAQTSPAHEIIVVDDGSPDDQNEIIERTYGDRVILVRKPNGKTASARNAGIERATGDFIAFLDADDYWEPAKLATQLAVFEQNPEVGMVAGRFVEQEPDGSRHAAGLHRRSTFAWDTVIRPQGADAFRLASQIWTGTVIIRRSAIADHRFVTGLEPAEDRDFWVRIAQDHPIYFCSESLATYVLEPGSISRSGIERDCTSMLKVVERHERLLGRMATREWKSHVMYRWAANESDGALSWSRLMESLRLWPLPYWGCSTKRFGRFRLLVRHSIAAVHITAKDHR
jgi:glycosyltransferase involved in cell wall biosynthesis